ncbi:YjgF-like protein [Aureobasidium melanogenum CBS 110374]|uniref:YjgF-like protein n=1 Tax=Aureobasidium melanogenum (strain CBS 110374) TaxID=1043003 RepID=A0A074VTH1_AURM1|nr:YjgF-like protein [Aureobasidium melanogenum CBS 110374]KEQ62544.1 YjgF-like protein [Aureobasidium melanogenum CBS 110374]
MNYIARSTRMGASSMLHKHLFPSSSLNIAKKSKSTLTQVFSDKAIHPIGPYYSQAIKANNFLFLSAQLPADESCTLVSGSLTSQTHKMISNARHVLEAGGSDLTKVVKVNLWVRDFQMLEEVNKVYMSYFPQRPARTVHQEAFLLKGADVMMDLVAVV